MKIKKIMDKSAKLLLPIAVTIFLFILALYSWDYINMHKLWFLVGSGAFIFIFIVLGYFIPKKFFKGLKKTFRRLF